MAARVPAPAGQKKKFPTPRPPPPPPPRRPPRRRARGPVRQRRWSPARRLVLVDQQSPDPFVEVVSTHDARHYAELGTHAFGKIERRAAPHLLKHEFEARGGFCAHQGGGRCERRMC